MSFYQVKMDLKIRLNFDDKSETLRTNQQNAVTISVNNNFKSGIHFHATGTGKSHIALEIIKEYHNKYPEKNIIWLCEQKSILIEQFKKQNIKKKGYGDLLRNFLIIDYKTRQNRYNIKICIFGKNLYCLLLMWASMNNYKKLKTFKLIIHDECTILQ